MSETRSILKFTVYLLMAIAVALICALTTSLCSCSADNGEEHPPAPLQSTTYDTEIDGEKWTATKVYDATSGRSWWLMHRLYTSGYVVLEGESNVPVG